MNKDELWKALKSPAERDCVNCKWHSDDSCGNPEREGSRNGCDPMSEGIVSAVDGNPYINYWEWNE